MSCSFYQDKGDSWSFRPYCHKKKDYVNDDVYQRYCKNYSYDECPIYKDDGSSSSCYLTSACVYAKGLPDDCHELETLRRFRDTWLKKQPGGQELVKRYYAIAPKIVGTINDNPDRKGIWEEIYEKMVLPCVKLIEEGKNTETVELYHGWTERLEREYITVC